MPAEVDESWDPLAKVLAAVSMGVFLVCVLWVPYFFYSWSLEQARMRAKAEESLRSLEESVQLGLLLGRYVPLTDSIRLRDGTALAVPQGWVSRRWGYDVSATFQRTYRMRDRIQLAFPFNRGYGPGNTGDYATNFIERGPGSGYTQGLRTDSILSIVSPGITIPVDTLRAEVWEERVPGGGLGGRGDHITVDTAVWVFVPTATSSGK